MFPEAASYESDGEFEDDDLLQMLRKQRAQYEIKLRFVAIFEPLGKSYHIGIKPRPEALHLPIEPRCEKNGFRGF